MGVDIYGTVNEDRLNDRHEDGKEAPYFRSNWWYWRPLWDFLYEHAGDILTAREHELGHYNCGPLLDSDKTRAIAKRLRSLITDGSVGNQEALAPGHDRGSSVRLLRRDRHKKGYDRREWVQCLPGKWED